MAKGQRGPQGVEQEEGMPGMGGDAARLVAEGHTLMRIQNETMSTVSVQRPRDEKKIIAGALGELDLVPEEAKAAFYTIPYKDRGKDGQVRVVNVTGLSISAAMALFRRWGNDDAGCLPLQEDATGWTLSGWFIDLETNARIFRPVRASKYYKPRGGGPPILLTVDRQIQAFQKGVSIAIRNAILAGLPAYLKNAYDKKARAIAGGLADAPADAKAVDAAIRAFTKWGITKDQLEKYLELPADQWTGTEVADLRGVWNAINDEQVEIAEVFGPDKEATPGVVSPTKLDGLTETMKQGTGEKPTGAPGPPLGDPTPPAAEPAAPAATSPPPPTGTSTPAPAAAPRAPAPAPGPPREEPSHDLAKDRSVLLGKVAGLRHTLALRPEEWTYLQGKVCGGPAATASVEQLADLYAAMQQLTPKRKK